MRIAAALPADITMLLRPPGAAPGRSFEDLLAQADGGVDALAAALSGGLPATPALKPPAAAPQPAPSPSEPPPPQGAAAPLPVSQPPADAAPTIPNRPAPAAAPPPPAAPEPVAPAAAATVRAA